MGLSYSRIENALRDGLLSFPITDMDENGKFNAVTFANRLESFVSHEVSTVFVAGGTGEFFSLSKEEYKQIVTVTSKIINGRVPTVSSVGRSTPEAIEFAKIAEEAGIDALLLMPPYLTECPQSGIVEYAKTIIQNTKLPVIYYNRANGILFGEQIKKLADLCPNFIALKDGTGVIEELNATIKLIGNRLIYIGGVPTAEIISEAYLSIGVNTYSSAVFNFVPRLANHFYKSLRAGDTEKVNKIIKEFFVPFIRLRSNNQGYAVSLIKAGCQLIGKSAGDVRAPLIMPTAAEMVELQKIIDKEEELLK
ncbi:5-dehydro-4-deoxyglucarate dehydratase [Flavobacterium sp. W22_SRS_FP1]|uniref:5-dehydro-4-deoxyglucarate dehydratase n=1 Tax=Flavobacterium sp. W22_SRS_FP1 TaxID=3240276 RepID=UPI003F8F5867